MMPDEPKIYHITHINNLQKIVLGAHLYADCLVKNQVPDMTDVGMSHIKKRRIQKIVPCYPPTTVGEYVPFYFCPRSVMLYILHKGNHADITYHGGQDNIITFEFDLRSVATWADQASIKWAFTDRNASTGYAQFYTMLSHLNALNWQAIYCPDFRQSDIKDAKQAEFLVYQQVPIHLVKKIGVYHDVVCNKVKTIWSTLGYNTTDIVVSKEWYF